MGIVYIRTCPNCGSHNFDGLDCEDCGFDATAYDINWD